ncbi:LysR family transcriptional regulator [Sphingomonas sp. KC8]|uniref:LysR family transcriptional regulator n=1 Tax=Sphingomonas sp. KC8 TaxID=1030157 RepID=UPI0002489795|nr:LysR substrate-binding domain-containing protein [Sphingomonas sp. KC8]
MILMLDPRLLRSFVVIADCGNFTRAAIQTNMTQSTISQQLARLELAVGHELIDRSSRPARPTAAGERLLGHARRILKLQDEVAILLDNPIGLEAVRIGLPEDLATSAMANAFARFTTLHPHIRLDVTTGLSRNLAAQYRAGELDIVVTKENFPAPDCHISFPEPLGWFERIDCTFTARDPIPLVTFPPGALYRDTMFDRIEQDGRRWYVAFTGGSLQSVATAVAAGLGVSLLPLAAARGYDVQRNTDFGPVPPMAISLYARDIQGAIAILADVIGQALAGR